MFELREAAALLGVSVAAAAHASDVGYLRLIEKGLPVSALERVAGLVAPSDAKFKFRIVPKASLARVSGYRLNANQSVLLARIATVWAQALRVWKSDDAVREFLFRPHPSLEGRLPIDLILENEIGASLVRGVLGRLEVGTAV
jgi:putative toxin-antitoxin system antitoxin component (TIGR02293 family)